MEYSTEIDSVGVRAEFQSAPMQRDVLTRLKCYVNSIIGLEVIAKEQMFGNGGKRVDYFVYYKNTTLASIKTGAYGRGNTTYFLNVVCTGLMSYDDFIDGLRYDLLLSICSWFNDNRVMFRFRELDCNIDAVCPYENFHVIQTKRAPRGKYNSSEEQVYTTTHYMQKKTKYWSSGTSALFYDKQAKEALCEPTSRFELKLLLKKEQTKDINILHKRIVNMFDRYAVFYFENLNVKSDVIGIQNYIENSNTTNKAMEYKKLMLQLNYYRLYPNIDYIMGFIHRLYTIKNFKMIVSVPTESNIMDVTSNSFAFDEMIQLP